MMMPRRLRKAAEIIFLRECSVFLIGRRCHIEADRDSAFRFVPAGDLVL